MVYSCPIIREAISDSGIISGKFSREDVSEMVRILEAGNLPARINPVPLSEKRIAPTRGKTTRRAVPRRLACTFEIVRGEF